MVLIEGIEVTAKNIPRQRLLSIWKALSNESFPKLRVLVLKDEDFDRVICLRRCKEDLQRELEEWGRILTTEGTDACVFNADKISGVDYMILIRENPYHSLKEILTHELTHIAHGDL